MLHNEDLIKWSSQLGQDSGQIHTTFKLIKTIYCTNLEMVSTVVDNLERLKQDSFNRIKVPKFSYTREGMIVIQEIEFIKGCNIACYPKKYWDIIHEDIVLRDDDWTFADFNHSNFIVPYKENTIYAVDLSSYGFHPDRYQRNSQWIHHQKFNHL